MTAERLRGLDMTREDTDTAERRLVRLAHRYNPGCALTSILVLQVDGGAIVESTADNAHVCIRLQPEGWPQVTMLCSQSGKRAPNR